LAFSYFYHYFFDPGYAYYISNNSEKDIYVYTNPPIKVYDKILIDKLIDSATIKPKETFNLFKHWWWW
jgi:hypothetical protein